MIEIKARIRIRRQSDAAWANTNPILAESELGRVTQGENRGRFKVGDGVKRWNDLEYLDEGLVRKIWLIEYVDELKNLLQQNIDNEANARQMGDSNLRQIIDNESNQRTQSDDNLRQMIDSEASQRAQADDAINNIVINEIYRRMQGDIETLESAKNYTDEEVEKAQLATQTWLAAVNLKSQLPTTGLATNINYLCRVIADTVANNGVWQRIAGSTEWTYFSDNQDWVDDVELAAVIAAHNANTSAHANMQTSITADATTADIGTAAITDTISNFFQRFRRGLNWLNAQKIDIAKLNTHIDDTLPHMNINLSGLFVTVPANDTTVDIGTGVLGSTLAQVLGQLRRGINWVKNLITTGLDTKQPKIIFGNTTTAAGTATKAVTTSGGEAINKGDIIAVFFNGVANTAAAAATGGLALQVNGGAVIQVRLGGGVPTAASGTGAAYIASGMTVPFFYDGTYFMMFGSNDITDSDTTFSAMTEAELNSGTATTGRLITPALLSSALSQNTTGGIKDLVCDTAAATVAKTITNSALTLKTGDLISVKFTLGNTASSPTLSINGAGAIAIKLAGGAPTGASGTGAAYCVANNKMLFHYDGDSLWLMGSQDITDGDTNTIAYNIYNHPTSALFIKAGTAGGASNYYPFVGICEDNTIDKITATSSSSAAGVRTFTTNKINLHENIMYLDNSTGAWTAGARNTNACYLSNAIGTTNWRYAIGQFYNKSGALVSVPSAITADNRDYIGPLYIGGTRDGDYFTPTEYSLTLRDTNKVYKCIGYFYASATATTLSLHLTLNQPVFVYESNKWARLGTGGGGGGNSIEDFVIGSQASSTIRLNFTSESITELILNASNGAWATSYRIQTVASTGTTNLTITEISRVGNIPSTVFFDSLAPTSCRIGNNSGVSIRGRMTRIL